jgi:hypothetical protein
MMDEAVTLCPARNAPAKPHVLNILVSKFFESQILPSPLLQNPRWARLSADRSKKI